ncbi:MAG: S4 domain-containing protein [Alphaproteobacteria bacterium]|nr:S4 domain-containing protein [Alphaproteobacteria bacterium]
MSHAGQSGEGGQRCDVWLFRARLFKSRSGAGRFIEGGGVRLERSGQVRRLTRASATVRPGDQLVYMRFGKPVRVTISGLGDRRGPAREAQGLYTIEAAGDAPAAPQTDEEL